MLEHIPVLDYKTAWIYWWSEVELKLELINMDAVQYWALASERWRSY